MHYGNGLAWARIDHEIAKILHFTDFGMFLTIFGPFLPAFPMIIISISHQFQNCPFWCMVIHRFI